LLPRPFQYDLDIALLENTPPGQFDASPRGEAGEALAPPALERRRVTNIS
jgi:hypothetical protein